MPPKLVVHMVPVDLFVSALVCRLSPPKDAVGCTGCWAGGWCLFLKFHLPFCFRNGSQG